MRRQVQHQVEPLEIKQNDFSLLYSCRAQLRPDRSMCFQFQYNEVMESLQRDCEVGNVLQYFCYYNVKFINNEGSN